MGVSSLDLNNIHYLCLMSNKGAGRTAMYKTPRRLNEPHINYIMDLKEC